MPETRVERALFLVGLLAIAALGFLVVHLWQHRQEAVPPPTSVSPPRSTPRTRTTAVSSTKAATGSNAKATTAASRTTTTKSRHSVRVVSLRLTAKSSTWLEVRSRSSAGGVLYAGTLTTGSSRAFRARTLWVRFGAAGNLIARLDGRVLSLPPGTYDAVFAGHGFRRVLG
jgi:hypothetical protein